jgi:hypothetical protein
MSDVMGGLRGCSIPKMAERKQKRGVKKERQIFFKQRTIHSCTGTHTTQTYPHPHVDQSAHQRTTLSPNLAFLHPTTTTVGHSAWRGSGVCDDR